MAATLGHALLGLLARQPATGYELARQLRKPVGYFWSAGHSQIYPELARLERDGLVRHTVIDGAGPRATKLYRLTVSGRKALRAWLLATTMDVDDREILLRVYLLFALRPAEAGQVLSAIRSHHERRLADYRAQRSELNPEPGQWSAATTSIATLEWGITFERARIQWCDEVLDQVGRGEAARSR